MAEEWISRQEAAAILGISERSVNRWVSRRRIRTVSRPHPYGRLYHRVDVEALASELNHLATSRPSVPAPEVIPPSELLDLINRKDQQLIDLQHQLTELAAQTGYLRGQLDMQTKRLTDAEAIQQDRDRLRQQLDRLPRWLRWLVNRQA